MHNTIRSRRLDIYMDQRYSDLAHSLTMLNYICIEAFSGELPYQCGVKILCVRDCLCLFIICICNEGHKLIDLYAHQNLSEPSRNWPIGWQWVVPSVHPSHSELFSLLFNLKSLWVTVDSYPFCIGPCWIRSQDSSISVVTGYRLVSQGLIPGRGKTFLSSPQHPDWLWGPHSLLTNGYLGQFPWG
jgi:hypothetical protein